MPIDFGRMRRDLENIDIPEIRSVVRGIKDVSKDGPLNFSGSEKIISSSRPEKTTRELPERDINDASSFVDFQRSNNNISSTSNVNTGPTRFSRPTMPSDVVSNIQTPDSLGVDVSPVTGPAGVGADRLSRLAEASPLAGISPSYSLNPVIPGKPASQILNEVSQRCADRILDELDNLDPSLRLEQLLNKARELCAAAQFTQLRNIIDRIQATKREIVQDAISRITDPLQRLAKLNDMLVDAINTGAQDLVEEITGLIQFEKFSNLLNGLDQLDPRRAIELINNEIRRLTDLRQFGAIRELLTAVSIIQSRFSEAESFVDDIFTEVNNLLQEPERLINSIQDKIREALDLNNYNEIQQIIDAYDSVRDSIDQILRELDPQRAIGKLITLANDALAELDLGRYNRILDDLANRLCGEEFGILPSLPDGPNIGPGNLPDFVR